LVYSIGFILFINKIRLNRFGLFVQLCFFTKIIGSLAAYYREKSNSLILAFIVHFMANVVGSLPLIFKLLMS